MTTSGGVKKKRVSKKSKTAWRKHTDVQDVNDFLEEQRLEERLGKFSEKPDSELFVVDTEGSQARPPRSVPLTRKQQKRQKLALAETPKCYEVLLPNSKVEDPNKKRNTVNPIGAKETALSKLSTARKLRTGVLARRLQDSVVGRKKAVLQKLKARRSRENFDKDLWTEDSSKMPEELKSEWITKQAVVHNLGEGRATRRPPGKALGDEPVPAPHPGLSYNPTYQEHQDLLQKVVEREKQLMRRERHLHRVTTAMFSRCTSDERETQWLAEMMSGLPEVGKMDAERADESDGEYRAVNPPVRNRKKDAKARRKQKEQILLKEKLRQAKIEKKKIADLYKLRFLDAALERAEERLQRLREIKTLARQRRAKDALPKLGPTKLLPKDPEYSAPQDLPGNLRQLGATGNPLRDRYECLQTRGVLAGAKLRMVKKKRVKSFFKAGHKVSQQDIDKYSAPPRDTSSVKAIVR